MGGPEFSFLPTLKARDAQAEGYEAGLRRSQPQLGTIAKGIVEGDVRITDGMLLRTPSVTDGTGGAISEKQARDRGRMVKIADQVVQLAFENGLPVSPSITASLLPTPTVAHMRNHDEPVESFLERLDKYENGDYKGKPGISLGVAVRMELLGTPRASSANGSTSSQVDAGAPKGRLEDQVQLLPTPVASEGTKAPSQQTSDVKSKTGQVWLSNIAKDISEGQNIELLPTVTTMEHREIKTPEQIAELKSRSPGGYRNLREVVINDRINWGKYEMAIRRWELIMGRAAPDPTKPDGKNGAHRLSSSFTEWMMGLPEGWITGLGLTRNEELKACGNGVVPQQAMLALEILDIEKILQQQGLIDND